MAYSNAYVDYLKEQLPNQLWTLKDNEHRSFYGNNNIQLPTPILDGFFDFYLNQLDFTVQELYQALTGNGNSSRDDLAYILASHYFEQAASRNSWIETFTPLLKTDWNLFKQCFNLCLTTHQYSRGDYSEEDAKTVYDNNLNIFLKMIDIGLESGHFSRFNESMFYTNNTQYQQLLIQKNVFNTDFSFSKMEAFLTSKNQDTPFFVTYFNDIIQLHKEKPQFLQDLENKQPYLIKQFLTQFFDTPVKYAHNAEEAINFTTFLIQNSYVRELLIKDSSIRAAFISKYSSVILPLFESLTISEKQKLFSGFDLNDSITERSYESNIKPWLDTNASRNGKVYPSPLFPENLIEFIYDNLQNHNFGQDKSVQSFMGKFLISHISTHLNNIEEELNLLGEDKDNIYQQKKIQLIHYADKYANFIAHGISLKKPTNITYSLIDGLFTILSGIKENNRDDILNKILNQAIPDFQTQLYEVVAPLKNSDHLDWYSKKNFWPNLTKVIQQSELSSILDILNVDTQNPLWKTFTTDLEKTNSKRKNSIYDDFPLVFVFTELSKGKALSWFLEPEHLEHLSEIKYKGKNLISFFSSYEWFPDMFNQLSQNKAAFKALILDSKPAVKNIQKLIDSNPNSTKYQKMKTILTYHELNDAVEEREVVKPRSKI